MDVWLRIAPTGDAHALLTGLASARAGRPVRLGHACPHCGSSAHGAPVLIGLPRGERLYGSLTRADGLDVVAVTAAGPIGVDAERVGAAGADVGPIVRHPAEEGADITRTWVRKEAVLKATGRGLVDDPRSVRLGEADAEGRVPVLEGPRVTLQDIDLGSSAGPGWVCAVAVAGDIRPLRVHLV